MIVFCLRNTSSRSIARVFADTQWRISGGVSGVTVLSVGGGHLTLSVRTMQTPWRDGTRSSIRWPVHGADPLRVKG